MLLSSSRSACSFIGTCAKTVQQYGTPWRFYNVYPTCLFLSSYYWVGGHAEHYRVCCWSKSWLGWSVSHTAGCPDPGDSSICARSKTHWWYGLGRTFGGASENNKVQTCLFVCLLCHLHVAEDRLTIPLMANFLRKSNNQNSSKFKLVQSCLIEDTLTIWLGQDF